MAEIVLERRHEGVRAAACVAVDDVSLRIADGEFMVLVGPVGLRQVDAAADDRRARGGDRRQHPDRRPRTSPICAPRERDLAMVFQSYALYPHMTVRQNLGYGLKVRRTPKAEMRPRASSEVARMLRLDELLDRRPAALSGGQRQRVAMGRAIVREPKAFLMDEPLSNLDAKLRVSMRAELAAPARAARRDDDLRHPRPGRGDDARPARRRDARRPDPAGRHAAGALPRTR